MQAVIAMHSEPRITQNRAHSPPWRRQAPGLRLPAPLGPPRADEAVPSCGRAQCGWKGARTTVDGMRAILIRGAS